MRTKLFYVFTLILAMAVTSCGLIPTQAKSSIDAINVDESTLAIKGYDPVAYFTLNTPTLGSSEYSSIYEGATYHFSTAEHLAAFNDNPAKYAPQYGGYCAFGVSKGFKYDTDPESFAVVDDKLYLNLNKKVQSIWAKQKDELIIDANGYWVDIENTPSSEL